MARKLKRGDRDPEVENVIQLFQDHGFLVHQFTEDQMDKLLSRSEILSVMDIQTEDVLVPEWGGTVRVRGLTGSERDKFEDVSMQRYGKKNQSREVNLKDFRARLSAWSIVDEDGKRVFSDSDITALGQKSAAALQRVFDVAARLSGLSESDVDELTKNSSSTQSEDSGSG
jgi:hypothetical protein